MKLILISKQALEISIEGGNSNELVQDILMTLPHSESASGSVIDEPITLTTELIQNLDSVVQKYASAIPKLHQIKSFVHGVGAGNQVYIVMGDVKTDTILKLQKWIYWDGNSNPELYAKAVQIEKAINSNYWVYSYDGAKSSFIGEAEKKKRVCRYCGRKSPEVTFKQRAHTISESLGNKNIFTNTECDQCNNRYGIGIEKEFSEFLEVIRAFYDIKGKNGYPQGGGNYRILRQNDNLLKIEINLPLEEAKAIETHKSDVISTIKLNSGQTFRPMNIYKALCKYVLGGLPDDVVRNYYTTIEWIDSKLEMPMLPEVAVLLTGFGLTHPKITFFALKGKNPSLPQGIGLVELADFAYLFVVPITADSVSYDSLKIVDVFYKVVPDLCHMKEWTYWNLSSNQKIPCVTNLDIKPIPKS